MTKETSRSPSDITNFTLEMVTCPLNQRKPIKDSSTTDPRFTVVTVIIGEKYLEIDVYKKEPKKIPLTDIKMVAEVYNTEGIGLKNASICQIVHSPKEGKTERLALKFDDAKSRDKWINNLSMCAMNNGAEFANKYHPGLLVKEKNYQAKQSSWDKFISKVAHAKNVNTVVHFSCCKAQDTRRVGCQHYFPKVYYKDTEVQTQNAVNIDQVPPIPNGPNRRANSDGIAEMKSRKSQAVQVEKISQKSSFLSYCDIDSTLIQPGTPRSLRTKFPPPTNDQIDAIFNGLTNHRHRPLPQPSISSRKSSISRSSYNLSDENHYAKISVDTDESKKEDRVTKKTYNITVNGGVLLYHENKGVVTLEELLKNRNYQGLFENSEIHCPAAGCAQA